jgi:4-hydroxyphenylacetate 3-monooxygenase
MASGNADRCKGFAEQCIAEYDLNGWTAPYLINPDDLQSPHRHES